MIAVVLLACSRPVAAAQAAPEAEAQQALTAWLLLWDAGKYDESYDGLAEHAKKDVSRAQWLQYWTNVRKPLGKVVSRKLYEAKHVDSLPTIPDRDGAMIQYVSSFETKSGALETIGMVHERDGVWRVAAYIVK